MKHTLSLLSLLFFSLSLNAIEYLIPIEGRQNRDWFLQNLIDKNPAKTTHAHMHNPRFANDYHGGYFTYDGHLGVDLAITSFDQMDRGVKVYASRSGIIEKVTDHYPDKNTHWDGSQIPGNGIVIRHDDGSKAIYGHIRRNSAKKYHINKGKKIHAGDTIAEVGSSGMSSGPHLHFELRDEKGNLIDPILDTHHQLKGIAYPKNPVLVDFGISGNRLKDPWKKEPTKLTCIRPGKKRLNIWGKLYAFEKEDSFQIQMMDSHLRSMKTKPYSPTFNKQLSYVEFPNHRGWALGDYTFVFFLNGKPEGKLTFLVSQKCR